jgi:hypothetical protein
MCKYPFLIRFNTTTAYHPQSNGMVQRAHWWLKDALKARLAGAPALGAARHECGKSEAEIVFVTTLTLPAQPAASQELPVDNILCSLCTAEPIPTRHLQKEALTKPPSQKLMLS